MIRLASLLHSSSRRHFSNHGLEKGALGEGEGADGGHAAEGEVAEVEGEVGVSAGVQGVVHAADFELGVKYNFTPLCPVDASGHFTAEAGPYAGREIFDANAVIVDDLQKLDKLSYYIV